MRIYNIELKTQTKLDPSELAEIIESTEKRISIINNYLNAYELIKDDEYLKPTELKTNSLRKEESVQTQFTLGEKLNYKNILVIHEVNGEKTEYPEDDIYVENEPVLNEVKEYTVSLEVLSEEIIVTYTIKVNNVDIISSLENAPIIHISESGAFKCEIEDIDLSRLKNKGKMIVEDSFASGGKYVQNYNVIGNCFGFKIISDKSVDGAKLVLRMANFAVTMIYPAENIIIYQNYANEEQNIKLTFNSDYYLTTRAPSMSDQAGADTSLVWCEIVFENISLVEGENSFAFVVIGKDAPFFDSAEIIVP